MTIVPNADESNLTFYFYDERRSNDVLKVQNGNLTVNGDKATSFVLPLVSDEGVMSNNGMNIINTFTIDTITKGFSGNNGEGLDFQITTVQDKMIDNLIHRFEQKLPESEEDINDPFRKRNIVELILQGDTVEASRSLNFVKKRLLEGTANVDTYKQMQEANDQLKASGSLEEKYIRSQTIDVKNSLEYIFKKVTGSDIEHFTKGNQFVFGNDIFTTMISHLIMSNKGDKKAIKGLLSKLIDSSDGNTTTSYGKQIEVYLEKLADVLPEIDLTATKEPTVTTAGRLHFVSPQNFRPFATLNSESKPTSP